MFERFAELLGDDYEKDLEVEYEDEVSAQSDVYADELQVKGDKKAAKKIGQYDEENLRAISKDLGDVLIAGKTGEWGGHRAALAMSYLEWAKSESNHYTPDAKLGFVDAAMKILAPVLSTMKKDKRWSAWLSTAQIEMHIAKLRENLHEKKANERVDTAVQEGLPQEQAKGAASPTAAADAAAKKARADIAAFMKASGKATEISNKLLNVDAFKQGEANIAAANNASQFATLRASKGGAALDALNDTLAVASALLEMTDEEFAQKQKILMGTPGLEHVRSRLDLVKAVHDLLAGGLTMTTKTTKLIAMIANRPELAEAMEQIADSNVLANIGHVATVISMTSSVLTMLDSSATRQQQWDAGASIVGSLVTFKSAAAGTTIGLTYALAAYSADLYWGSRSGIMQSQMGGAFKSMTRDSDALVRQTERLVAIGALLDNETDDGQRAALMRIQQSASEELGHKIDTFLGNTTTYAYDIGAAYKAGSYSTLREAFSDEQKHAGKRDPYETIVGANEIIKQIAWCFKNMEFIVKAETAGGNLATVKALSDEDAKKKAELARRKALQKKHYEDLAAGETEEPAGWSVDDGGGA